MGALAQAYRREEPDEIYQPARSRRAIDFRGLARRVEAARARRAQESAEINVALAGLVRSIPANDDAPVRHVVTRTPSPAAPIQPAPAPAPVREVVTKPAPRTRRKKVRSGLRQRGDAHDMRAEAQADAGEAV